MCIINNNAEVTTTKIFTCASQNNARQLVVYSNNVATTDKNTAMILPVPYPETIKLHDLSNYSLFTDLAVQQQQQQQQLKVHDIGSYQVSICQSISDFDRLDNTIFKLNVTEFLTRYYTEKKVPFGFLVCKLQEGNISYQPIAYSHRIYNSHGYLFVPTRHYVVDAKDEVLWDHQIYSLNTNQFGYSNKQTDILTDTGSLVLLNTIQHFKLPKINRLQRIQLKGNIRNCDIYLTLENTNQSNTFLALNGGVFHFNDHRIKFERANTSYTDLLTRPYIQAKNGKYFLSAKDTIVPQPILCFADRLDFILNKGILKLTDTDTIYTFNLKDKAIQMAGQNLILGTRQKEEQRESC